MKFRGRTTTAMLTIDGWTGGGQVLRTALSLSALTGTPFEIEGVRGARPEPGLKSQHLAAVRVMADLCDAGLDGAELGSTELAFDPESLAPETTTVDLRTAGSVTLLFDTVLPVATGIDEPFALTARGGTDVKWSPPIASLDRVKLPLLTRFGYDLAVEVARTGFYPAGGGEATLEVGPSSPAPFDLDERGPLEGIAVHSKASEHLADADVADRQARQAAERLDDEGFSVTIGAVDYVETRSPGSSLLLRAEYEYSLAGFDELGERGKPSEDVADDAVDAFLAFHDGPGAVDRYLADQLLVPLALAGGVVLAPQLTDHIETNAAVIEQFGFGLSVSERDDGSVLVEADA